MNKDFWLQNFNTQLKEEIALPENYHAYIIEVMDSFELALFPLDFIKKYSPEVASNKPSVMFFTEALQELHAKLQGAGEIIESKGTLTFNFPDPDGNYYVVAQK